MAWEGHMEATWLAPAIPISTEPVGCVLVVLVAVMLQVLWCYFFPFHHSCS